MAEIIDNFITYGILERNFSKNTASAYRNDLIHLYDWANEQKKNINTLSNDDLTNYLIHKKTKGYEFSSIARMLFCFRIFFMWLILENIRLDNPCELLETPKLWTTLPELLSTQEIEILLNNISGKPHLKYRQKAIVETLYGCGLRISELVNLKIENVNFDKNYLICFGKGSKERVIPFGKVVKHSLMNWILKGRIKFSTENKGFVFISQKNTKISRQHVWLELKQLALKSNISKNIYPHIFRHSYATHLLAGGGDLRIVQELLGHSDIMTTQKYTQVDKTHILKQYSKFHPRAT